MTPSDLIIYDDEQFPIFYVNIIDQETVKAAENMEYMEVTIATESLSRKIIDKNGSPIDKRAERIDNDIYFYIPDKIADKKPAEIADYVSDNCW